MSTPTVLKGSDAAVQNTNDDAQISKLSCVRLGYFKDDFIQYFVRRASRRSPLINRGYYSRITALRHLLYQFLAAGHDPATGSTPPKQVLSLGAGFDTTWFQLQSEGIAPARYIEVDFAEVTHKKANIIGSKEPLYKLLGLDKGGEIDAESGRIVTDQYCLLPADLRDLKALEAALTSVGFQPELPTFILSECVLVYMRSQDSDALVHWLGRRLPTAVFVLYEQIKPDDAFGQQMLMNIESRGCPLLGIRGTPSLESHVARFRNNGWQRAEAKDMNTIYRDHLDPQDKRRAERLEIFDEFEEWHLIQEHYCIATAINDTQGIFRNYGLPENESIHKPLPCAD
ncbi:hypothetical protein WJX72_010045 [[Myrmecia] bisecta]|uniref:Leucine carboxyl methyltransferase 1 homolog n=1 Tax=[Myrmecia] bisecta TaxID=41462 RepID=A0AAW1R986_9CHLO